MPFNMYYLPGYQLETCNRANKVGVMLVCMDYDLIESIFIESDHPGNESIIAGVVYKPPSASFNEFISNVQDLL